MNNINNDAFDSRLNTQAPFTWSCNCTLGGEAFTGADFIGCKFMLPPGFSVPVCISGIEPSGDGLDLLFTANGISCARAHIAGTFNCAYGILSSFIYSEDGLLSGCITLTEDAARRMLRLVGSSAGAVKAPYRSFMLLPECCTPSVVAGTRVIGINGIPVTADITLSSAAGVETHASYSGNALSLVTGAFGNPVEDFSNAGITSISVRQDTQQAVTADARGRHLILKPLLTSNLRLAVSGNSIVMKGVSDE